MCFGDGDGGPDLDVLVADDGAEEPRGKVADGIHGDDLARVGPGGEGADGDGGLGVGEVRPVIDVQVLAGDGEGVVDGVGAAVGADGVASPDAGGLPGDYDGAALGGVGVAPGHGEGLDAGLAGVGGEDDAGGGCGLSAVGGGAWRCMFDGIEVGCGWNGG